MNITVISIWDYAGAGQHIVNAVNRVGRHHAVMVRQGNKPRSKDDVDLDNLAAILTADVIHIKGDEPLWKFDSIMANAYGVDSFADFEVPLVMSVEGSTFRRQVYPPEDYRRVPLYALSPELAYPAAYNAQYIPQAFNSTDYANTWQPKTPPIISHSPSNRAVKGTGIFIEAFPDLDLIEDVPLRECIERKAKATMFLDQCKVGFYGYSGIEAGAQGVPFGAFIPSYAMEKAGRLLEDCPVIRFVPEVASIRDAVLAALDGDMAELSQRTKNYVDRVHGYENTGKLWCDVYEALA